MISPLLLPEVFRVWWKCRSYEPIEVTPRSIVNWLSQYPAQHHAQLLAFARSVVYLDKQQVLNALIEGHRKIERALAADGIGADRMIYVQVGDAASSSPVMLNMLRDAERFERRKMHMVDSRDAMTINELTAQLNTGAIVYIDDFAGSGRQFLKARKFTTRYVAGSFSEFFLSVVICEEAVTKLLESQISPVSGIEHKIVDRPLHESSTLLPASTKSDLSHLGSLLSEKYPLGFNNLATNVVLYRNAPNSTPLLLRGSLNQTPYKGILPCTRDLPVAAMST